MGAQRVVVAMLAAAVVVVVVVVGLPFGGGHGYVCPTPPSAWTPLGGWREMRCCTLCCGFGA